MALDRSGLIALALLCLIVAGSTGLPAAAAKAADPAEILAKAEEVRSPNLDYAVDFEISVLDNYTPGKARTANYSLVARGKDHSIVLMVKPEGFYGGSLLIADGDYWLLLPKATKTLQLTSEQVLRGDIANGDLARANLLSDYEARLDGEERIDKDLCWRLELSRKKATAHFTRIRCWIAKKGFLPRKFEYFGQTGEYVKTARYGDYKKTPLGIRSMKLEIDNPGEMQRTTTMTFTDLRKIDASLVRFTPEGLVAFRDVAMAKGTGEAPARIEKVVAGLAADKS